MTDAARHCSQTGQPKAAADAVAASALKRAFDIAISTSALLFLAPLFLVVALAMWAESARPVLSRQRRTGLNGETFVILKFRTMNGLEDGHDLHRADIRVTRVEAFLRKSGIDELPQLLNVLRGDMSLVGPHPHAPAHDQDCSTRIPNYSERFRARPGLTGLAQVSGLRGESHGQACKARRASADVAYVEDWSFWLDIRIILATMRLIVSDRTAY